MLVTQLHALTLWCPASGEVGPGSATGRCIARKCMWWRWYDYLGGDTAFAHNRSTGELMPAADRRGYCGMAGTP